ncbi:MAG: TIM44-like domain-containing protein [Candidatus Riflebacteria bacterium]|nr:TIM44-like domain-containing protein [Candidatus Riflebacteria bacterium]
MKPSPVQDRRPTPEPARPAASSPGFPGDRPSPQILPEAATRGPAPLRERRHTTAFPGWGSDATARDHRPCRHSTAWWVVPVAASLLLTVLVAPTLLARAGGGEGFPGPSDSGGGGGGGGGLDGDAIYLLLRLIELSIEQPLVGIPLLILVIAIIVYSANEGKERYVDYTIRRGTQAQGTLERANAERRLRERDPAWNQARFLTRVRQAFTAIQEGWSRADLAKAQAFLSDGVYDRFQILLRELAEAGLRDHLEELKVLDTTLRQVESDPGFDTVHVSIRASATNYRVAARTGKWVEGPTTPEVFEEVWSFLRRPGARTLAKPGLLEGFCPNCSAPIEIVRVAICPVCNSYLRSGEHDWVLADITQACEWTATDPAAIPGMKTFQRADPGFNVQHLEDRAAVIFWRHALAERTGDPAPMRKFALDRFMEGLTFRLKPGEDGTRSFYTRCAVGAVVVKAVLPGDPFDRVFVEVAWSGRLQERQADGRVVQAGKGPRRLRSAFVLVRRHGVTTEVKASLDSSHCPNCGAPEQTGQEFVCPYCDTVLNDGSRDWTLEKLLSATDSEVMAAIRQARDLDQSRAKAMTPVAGGSFGPAPAPAAGGSPVPVAATTGAHDRPGPGSSGPVSPGPDSPAGPGAAAPTGTAVSRVRAPLQLLEWLVATMLADGVIDDREMVRLGEFGERNGIPEAKVRETIVALRESGRRFDSLPVPESPEEAREMLREMAAMALADGRLSDDEMTLLTAFGKRIALSPVDVKMLITKERTRLFQEARRALQNLKALPRDPPPA